MKKKAIMVFLLAALLLLSSVASYASEIPDPTSGFFVADFADVIDDDVEKYIIEKNAGLSDATGAQIVIAAVNFTGSTPIDDYCYEMFNEWGVGDKSKDNGVLLLMVIGDDDYYIIAGTGLENYLTGGVLGNLLDEYLEPYFAEGDYSAGAKSIFDALYGRLASYYNYSDGEGDVFSFSQNQSSQVSEST